MSTSKTDKRTSRLKIFGMALLCYIILNIAFSIAYLLFALIGAFLETILPISLSVTLIEGASLICGGVITYALIEKLVKSDTDEKRVVFTIGAISILLNAWSLIDVLIYGDEFSYRYILFIFVGIIFIANSKKRD